MGNAWIDGKAATVREAAVEAARMLAASRFPLIAGLGTDVAGVRAAVALAERLGAAIDHMHSAVLFKDLDVMRDAGMMITTPNEARMRGERLLLVGGGLMVAWPELRQRLVDPPLAPEAGDASRRVIWLCPGRAEQARESIPNVETIGRDPADLPVVLAALRARLAGRPVGKTRLPAKTIDALAADLQAARFGVAVWAAAELDELAIEMLCGLIKDLNAKTRFTGLPLQAGRQRARRLAGMRLADGISHAHRLWPTAPGARSVALRRRSSGGGWRSRLRAMDIGLSRDGAVMAARYPNDRADYGINAISPAATRTHRSWPTRDRSRRGRLFRGGGHACGGDRDETERN